MAYDIAIVIGVQLIAFCLFYLGMNVKGEKHAPFKILLIIFGMYVSLTNFEIMRKIAVNNSQTAIENILISNYQLFLYLIIFTIFYIILIFIWEAFQKTTKVR